MLAADAPAAELATAIGTRDDAAGLRVPPHSQEAEQAVLGALLMDAEAAFPKISDLLSEADFYRRDHRLIFGAIGQLVAAGQPVDILTVHGQLEGEVADFGGLPYLNQLAQGVPSVANVRRYAEKVAARAMERAMIAFGDEVATAGFNPQGRGVIDLLEDARIRLARIADRSKVGTGRRLPVLTGPELIAAATSMRWLCKGILPTESIGMVFGASGTFKSFLVLDAALHVVHGLPWLGRRTEQGQVLWIAAEGGRGFGHRVNAWHRARRLQPNRDLIGIPASIDLGTEAWRVVDEVQARVAGIAPKLVVIDTLSQTYTAGADENSATDMAAYLRQLGARFRDLWKCTVIVIHHSGHIANDRPRGSSAIQANTDFLFGCWRDEKEMLATLSCEHMKDGDRFDDAMFSLSKVDLGTDEHGDHVTHLAARHLSNADEIGEAAAVEVKAGRGGKNQLLLQLLQNGEKETALRKAFYEACDVDNPDFRRKAYTRARKWGIEHKHLEIAQGVVIDLRGTK